MASKRPLYFGCRSDLGHHLRHAQDGRLLLHGQERWIISLDGSLPPRGKIQVEGLATLTYLHGYSILAFWDRSVNTRPGSNSIFLIPGELSFDQTVVMARTTFPMVWERFKFEVVQYGKASDE